jgi:hypothetical protein
LGDLTLATGASATGAGGDIAVTVGACGIGRGGNVLVQAGRAADPTTTGLSTGGSMSIRSGSSDLTSSGAARSSSRPPTRAQRASRAVST